MPDEQQPPIEAPVVPNAVTEQSQVQPEQQQVDLNAPTVSDADWAIFDKAKTPTPPATADGKPVVEDKPVEKKPEPAQQQEQKLPQAVEKKEPDQKPEGDELPDLEKLEDNIPKTHKELVKQRNKMGKELRLSRTREKEMADKIAKLEELAAKANPEKEEEYNKKIATLNADVERERVSRAEAEDRLYASNVQNRPEWQKYVVEPWKNAKATMATICKRNNLNPQDVWDAYENLTPDKRDEVYSEMLETMNQRDRHTFNAIVDSVPQIVANQKHLELDSKEKRDAYKQREDAQQEQERTKRTGTALSTAQGLFEQSKKDLPGLFNPEGDTPELKDYRAQIERTRVLAEDIAKKGLDTLRPDIQGRMVHDALFADTLRNGFNIVLQAKEKENGDLKTKIKELEAANASLQETVDGYADGTSLVGSGGQRGVPAATNGDESVSDLFTRYFPAVR